MADVTLDRVSKRYGPVIAVDDVSLRIAARRADGAGRPLGLRQVDAAAHDRRPGDDQLGGTVSIGGRVVNDVPPQGPRDRHGLPELRALPAHDGAPEPRVRAAHPRARRRAERDRRVGEPPAVLGIDPLLERYPKRALRRPAPAGGGGARHRAPAGGVPLRRAALQPRRQAARADARRAHPPAPPPRRHHGLRHSRPGRGDDARRPHRGAARRPAATGGGAARGLRAAPERLRRAASSARRR